MVSTRRMTPYAAKPTSSTSTVDDATIDSDSEESVMVIDAPEPVTSHESFNTKRRNRLTAISKKYDLDGDGVLDEAEQVMRDRDVANRGYLTKPEIYMIVQQQLKAKQKAGHMKKLIVGLICFVVLLALSNLGTSMAAAILAKDLKADDGNNGNTGAESTDGVPKMRISKTGMIAAVQSVANMYSADDMSDEEFMERRRLVVEEMEEDPHSHQHRRELKKAGKNCNKMGWDCDGDDNGDGDVTYDTTLIPEERFADMERDCKQQKNVYLERKWGDNKRNECICSRGTSVVVKEKKNGKKGKDNGKKTNKDKKKKNKNKKEDTIFIEREVIFENEDGSTLHADCNNGICACGGGVLLGQKGDVCQLNRDECMSGLICERQGERKLRSVVKYSDVYGTCQRPTVDSEIIVRTGNNNNGKRGDWCDADKKKSCANGLWCQPDRTDENVNTRARNGRRADATVVTYDSVGTCQKTVGRGQSCWHDGMCGKGNFCNGGSCVDENFTPNIITIRNPGNGRGGWYKSFKVDVHGQCTNDGNNNPGDPTYDQLKDCCEQQLPWRSYRDCAPDYY